MHHINLTVHFKRPNREKDLKSGCSAARLRRILAKLGSDIGIARRKRALTVEMMAERVGVAKTTYLKVEKGDPSVSMGIYAMSLFVLGLHEGLGTVADAGRDDTGLLLDTERLPKRIRVRKEPKPL